MVETAYAQWKIAKINENQHRIAKISTSYRKSMSMILFSVRYLRPEVELMPLLHTCADFTVTFETDGTGQTPS